MQTGFLCTVSTVGERVGTLRIWHNDPCRPPADVRLGFACQGYSVYLPLVSDRYRR